MILSRFVRLPLPAASRPATPPNTSKLFQIRYFLLTVGFLGLPLRIIAHIDSLRKVRGESAQYLALGQLLHFGTLLPILCLCGMIVLHHRRMLSARDKLLAVALGVTVLAGDLGTGLLGQVFWTLVPVLFAHTMVSGKLPTKWIAIGLALLIPFAAAKESFRSTTWSDADLGVFERAEKYVELAFDAVSGKEDSDELAKSGERALSRVDYLSTLAWTTELTPSPIPYWGGETYSTLLWTFIPRILYPEKPTKRLGQEFGHRYGFLDPTDTITSFNLAQLVEFQINFGEIGVFFGMMFMGGLYRLVQRFSSTGRASDIQIAALAPAVATLTNIESDLSLVLAGVFLVGFFGLSVFYAGQRIVSMTVAIRPGRSSVPKIRT